MLLMPTFACICHHHLAVVVFGVPFVYTESRVLRARLEFLRREHQISERDFLNFDAMRSCAQCVGRVIRSKHDYGLMVFADKRYTQADKRDKLPLFVTAHFDARTLNLSTDGVVTVARRFFREMAQPRNAEDERVAAWSREDLEKNQRALAAAKNA
jgi:DNA excision repair protein ERCC-2